MKVRKLIGIFVLSFLCLNLPSQAEDLLRQWAYEMIRLQEAMNLIERYGRPKEVVVAVLDPDAIDISHPDLSPQIWRNPDEIPGNGKDDDGNGYIDDVYGLDVANKRGITKPRHSHATHIAGIYCVGMPYVKLMSIKMDLPEWWTGDSFLTLAYVLGIAMEGIKYAVDNGAEVINMSWGTLEDIVDKMAPSYNKAFLKAVRYAEERGVVFLIAAGNSNTDQFFPADIDASNTITVAAVDETGCKTSYSNWAPWVDVSAPAKLISTVVDGGYAEKMGTSMATPVVGKVVVLLKQIAPDLNVSEIKRIIMVSTNPADENYSGFIGTGIVDAEKVVKVAYLYSMVAKPLLDILKRGSINEAKDLIKDIPQELMDEEAKGELLKIIREISFINCDDNGKLAGFILKSFEISDLVRLVDRVLLYELKPEDILRGINISEVGSDIIAKVLEHVPSIDAVKVLKSLSFERQVDALLNMDICKFLDIAAFLPEASNLFQALKDKDADRAYAIALLKKIQKGESGAELRGYIEDISDKRILAKVIEHVDVKDAIDVLKNLNLIQFFQVLDGLSMPFLDKLVSSNRGRYILSQKLAFPGDRTFNAVVRLINHGTARTLDFLKDEVLSEYNPHFIAQFFFEVSDPFIFKFLTKGTSREAKLVFVDELLKEGPEAINEFFHKYTLSTYVLFLDSLICTSCCKKCKGEECEKPASNEDIYKKVALLLSKLDEDKCEWVLSGMNHKIITKLIPYLPQEYRYAVLESIPMDKYVKVSYELLTKNSSILKDNMVLDKLREGVINVYRTFFKEADAITPSEIGKAVSILNSLPSVDSALVLLNILEFREERGLDQSPLVNLGKKVNEGIIADFLWFDDYWRTNFSIVTKILYARGVESTASIFNQAKTYAVAMVLKSEKLEPQFVAKAFTSMDKGKVLDVVDDLLHAPFVGNEGDPVPYLLEIVKELEKEDADLASKIVSIIPKNIGKEGENTRPSPIQGEDVRLFDSYPLEGFSPCMDWIY